MTARTPFTDYPQAGPFYAYGWADGPLSVSLYSTSDGIVVWDNEHDTSLTCIGTKKADEETWQQVLTTIRET